jgi:hypothetical protein
VKLFSALLATAIRKVFRAASGGSTMKAPHYERLEVLTLALEKATFELRKPIDRVEVVDQHVRCWAGSKMVTLLYDREYSGSLDCNGNFVRDIWSGRWYVEVVEP